VHAAGTIFRFVASVPAGPAECLSYHETKERPNAPACQRCGLSVFRKNEIKFYFDDHLFDKVSDAWISEERITVVGERIGTDFKALDIQESTTASAASEETESE
jgi:hypothetical protein